MVMIVSCSWYNQDQAYPGRKCNEFEVYNCILFSFVSLSLITPIQLICTWFSTVLLPLVQTQAVSKQYNSSLNWIQSKTPSLQCLITETLALDLRCQDTVLLAKPIGNHPTQANGVIDGNNHGLSMTRYIKQTLGHLRLGIIHPVHEVQTVHPSFKGRLHGSLTKTSMILKSSTALH